ncbi:MAG: oligoendopeptidase F, partial [Thermoanaerobaculia bacterium]
MMTTTTVMTPARFAAYELKGWDLSELLPQPAEEVISARLGEKELGEIEAAVSAFEARRADLHPDMEPATFLEILRQYESLQEQTGILSGYASLWFYADTSSQEALAFRNRVRTAMTTTGNRILFFTLWWRALSDDEAERLLPQGGETADQRHYLRDLRRLKPYTLDEKSEQIINLKDENGIGAVNTLYSMLTNRLEFKLEVDGEARTLTR